MDLVRLVEIARPVSYSRHVYCKASAPIYQVSDEDAAVENQSWRQGRGRFLSFFILPKKLGHPFANTTSSSVAQVVANMAVPT